MGSASYFLTVSASYFLILIHPGSFYFWTSYGSFYFLIGFGSYFLIGPGSFCFLTGYFYILTGSDFALCCEIAIFSYVATYSSYSVATCFVCLVSLMT